MSRFQMALLLEIEAPSYEAAKDEADQFAQQADQAYLITDLGQHVAYWNSNPTYEHDNDGQRVLYLHGEDSCLKDEG